MADLSADTLAFWLAQDATNTNYRPLFDVKTDLLAARLPERSAEQRADLAERLLLKISDSLGQIARDSIDDGVEPSFELSSEESTLYFKVLKTDALSFRDKLLKLTPAGFEDFCASLLKKLGGDARVIGKTGDGGIDFVARNISLSGSPGPATIGAQTLVLGQAKRYARDNLVVETDLRGFVGSAMKRSHDPEDVATYRRAILAPLSLAFWTTSDFQPSAKRYAKIVGLWYLNGTGLAQLALRLGVKVAPPE